MSESGFSAWYIKTVIIGITITITITVLCYERGYNLMLYVAYITVQVDCSYVSDMIRVSVCNYFQYLINFIEYKNRNIFWMLKKNILLIWATDWCRGILSNSTWDILHFIQYSIHFLISSFSVSAVILKRSNILPLTFFFAPINLSHFLTVSPNYPPNKTKPTVFPSVPSEALSNCECVLHLKRASL